VIEVASHQWKKRRIDGNIGVFVLDPDGDARLPGRSWRGTEVFVGVWEMPLEDIVPEIEAEVGMVLQLHALVRSPERTWLVLRPSGDGESGR
jgi:hypothetical protein